RDLPGVVQRAADAARYQRAVGVLRLVAVRVEPTGIFPAALKLDAPLLHRVDRDVELHWVSSSALSLPSTIPSKNAQPASATPSLSSNIARSTKGIIAA